LSNGSEEKGTHQDREEGFGSGGMTDAGADYSNNEQLADAGGGVYLSFVYAKKVGQLTAIFADTKISFDQPDYKQFFGKRSKEMIRQFGMIKNIIISHNFCISYAGNNIIHANNLLQRINHLSLHELLALALEENQKDIENGTEFIICYANCSVQNIYQIKNGKCDDVPAAWIGSYDAFNYFQGVRNGAYGTDIKSNDPYGVELSFGTSPKSCDESEYELLFNAFHKTIFDCGDSTVGGFVVPVLFDLETNQFWYKGYIKSYSKMKKTPLGLSMPVYQGPESGSFSIIFYESPAIVGVYIPENNWGIIYNHFRKDISDYRLKQTSSFLIPSETKISQLDFYVQAGSKGMKPPGFLGFDPDKIDDYIDRVWFYRDKPELAILYIEKAIEIVSTQHRDEWRLDELIGIRKNIRAGLNLS
jgi:hypothetical protein